ncbi:hypothetical protein [Nonomuraea sp. NPDC046570]|uniref:hypothetical protein n=1 Tax=Nonomuraea sp. NPDC046570 TaxID=3155255 RepID=UPI0033F470F7
MRRIGVLAVLALALAGCGGGDGGGTDVASADGGGKAAATASPSVDPQRGLKFAQCMRENGIDMPDPEPGKPVTLKLDKGISEEAMNKAQQACKEYAPQGGTGPKPGSKQLEGMRKVAQCMRENGVPEYPDPDGGLVRIKPEVGEDPDFKDAQAKCTKEFMPEAGQGGS